MASREVYDAIRGVLDPNEGGSWTATQIAWPNEGTENFPPADGSAWIAVQMTGTSYAQESIGAAVQAQNRWDEEGILWLHTFVATGQGERDQRSYCKQLADLFRGLMLLDGNLEFLDASIGLGEQSDDTGAWWRISVSIEWRRFEA
jgi:hypothetical protein